MLVSRRENITTWLLLAQHKTWPGATKANKLLRAKLPHPMPSDIALDLSIDQPPSFLDYEMVENARQALEAGQTHYVDVPGIAPLREALAAHLIETGVTGYSASELLVSAGIQEARFLALQMMAGPGGEVAVPDVVHPGVLKAIGVRPLKVRSLPTARERGCLPAVAALRQALQGGVRLVYLESPSRLTGAIYSPEEVQEIGQLVREYGAACDLGSGACTVDRRRSILLTGLCIGPGGSCRPHRRGLARDRA